MEHLAALVVLDDDGLQGEFLWDDDWRMDQLMDLPPTTANALGQEMGLDLEVVQALPGRWQALTARAGSGIWAAVRRLR